MLLLRVLRFSAIAMFLKRLLFFLFFDIFVWNQLFDSQHLLKALESLKFVSFGIDKAVRQKILG